MSRVLVLGCGEPAWGRPSTSTLFGSQWNRGRLSEKICFGPEGPVPGDAQGLDWVTLAGELDRRMAWCPKAALWPAPTITIARREPAKASILPGWPALAALQARWATLKLGGPGVLVTPRDWLELPQGRQLLDAWAAERWSWAALEKVLEGRLAAGARYASASENWLRVTQLEGGTVLANGPEAARALETATAVLDRALDQLGPELAGRWRLEEEPVSGWYVHQQLTYGIVRALREGRTKVELGGGSPFRVSSEGRMSMDRQGTGGALFGFSSAVAQDRYPALSSLRITVELPPSEVPWWERVSLSGLLRDSHGVLHPGIRWDERRTILLEGREIRRLASYLASHNLEQEEVDPARFEEALALGAPLPPRRTPAPAEPGVDGPPLEGHAGPTPPLSTSSANASGIAGTLSPAAAALPTRTLLSAVDPGPASPGTDLPTGLDAWDTSDPREVLTRPATSSGTAEGAEVTALTGFLPHQFSLDTLHRPDRVKVWLDGQLVEDGNVHRSAGRDLYTITGVAVPHGAIVRVDFEPPHE
ncbi:MAG: hypothetical protein M3O15_07660 [Acidobacteriota bacterium]|nr:hypothetical protein [Acidobacteriota bacterium]